MGKQRRKFETGFKQQIVSEVESGLLSVSAASRKYQISDSVIDGWRQKARQSKRRAIYTCVPSLYRWKRWAKDARKVCP